MKTPFFEKRRPRLIVLVGPTAVGKTDLAIQLAQAFEGEVVSADSRYFYRGMDIGTAKPSWAERAGVPHHLIDVADPDEVWSLGRYQVEARRAIADIQARGRLPFLVGGTGQYIRSVIQGWEVPRVEADPQLRAVLGAWAGMVGSDGLHARLAVLDPVAAAAIDYRNLRRTVRALEVIFTTGKRFSEQRSSIPSPYNLLQIGITRPRPELYERIDARIRAMFAAGLVQEVQALLEKGYGQDLPSLSAIGYREVIAHLQGKISLEEAERQMQHNTRVFVRRQANWFKPDDPSIHWFPISPNTLSQVKAKIALWLETQPLD